MFLLDGVVVYSPTDITRAACPFDLLWALDEKLGRRPELEVPEDPMLRRAALMGDAHEERVLQSYRDRFGPHTPGTPGGVAEVRDEGEFRASLVPAREATMRALADGADVVFQATFFDGRFYGRADFLLREDSGAGGESALEAGSRGVYRWAVVDTKLTNKVRSTALMQMAAYADQLIAAGVPVADRVTVHHGNGERSAQKLADLLEVYRTERAVVQSLLDAHAATGAPVDWEEWRDPLGEPAILASLPAGLGLTRRACGRCDACTVEVERTRDVQLVHGIRSVQRTRLYGEGVRGLVDLAQLSHPVPRMTPVVQERLVRQAGMQVAQLARVDEAASRGLVVGPGMRLTLPDGAAPPPSLVADLEPVVRARVVAPQVLRALPEPSPGDLYFDFEGDPMWSVSGAMEGGLEYLFGLVQEGPAEEYVAFWAHDRGQEKVALREFLAYVRERRRRYPDLHIYHYASYERTALERLAERHGEGLEAVLTLAREGVLVDLFPVVRSGVAVGQESYSIKKLEPLYMGEELREAEVTTGGDSVAQYAAACAARRAGDEEEFERVMAELADYNRYDCVSTRRLVQWLRSLVADDDGLDRGRPDPALDTVGAGRQVRLPAGALPGGARVPLRAGTPGEGGQDLEDGQHDEADGFAPTSEQVLQRLLAEAAGDHPYLSADHAALAMLAASLDYHRRENAPVWRAHFERLGHPVDWWADVRDVLVIDPDPSGCEVLEDWAGGPRSERRALRLTGTLGSGSTPENLTEVFCVYPIAESAGLPRIPGAAYATTRAKVTDATVSPDGTRASLSLTESAAPEFASGPGAAASPIALVPGAPIEARSVHTALVELAQEVAGRTLADIEAGFTSALDGQRMLGRLRTSPSPGLAVLRRQRPAGLVPARDADSAAAILTSLTASPSAAIGVQGPPGTGKTFVGSHVIARLVTDHGWRVGVVAQSHAVVEHLLDRVVDAGLTGDLVGKRPKEPTREGEQSTRSWTELGTKDHADFLARHRETGCVVGGTAWDLTNRNRIGEAELDLVVIDEAGQFSLANTLAVASAGQRLLLLGDPQQLPQVTQGSHSEPVDTSALAWLTQGSATMPPDRGYFLARSWRMHPDLCAVVSDLSYDGRLSAQETVTRGRALAGQAPGLHAHPVTHSGNSSASREEAQEVVRIVRDALGRAWNPGGSAVARPLEQRDIIVVAGYNAQVTAVRSALDSAGLTEIRVGTVDKFQGQEGAIAIVTLAASSARDAPRGADFLLNRNRLNVALSRAQWAAHLVYSPGLTDALPHGGDALADLGAFLRLIARATPRMP
ncbi:TM0106 family RecB-like putative nuclease [Serinibacter salmoneus]|nr:bifunctional RecB family nuclease/DEAD/DEAH box helicase [Serinibacter salmoneus]